MKPVIFFDVDGTLVDPVVNRIPESALNSIRDLRARGYLCCVATGRGYENLKTNVAFRAIEWDGYICCNGQEVLRADGSYVFQEVYSEKTILKVLDIAKENGHLLSMLTTTEWLLVDEPNEYAKISFSFLHEPIPEISTYKGQTLLSFLVFGPKGYDYAPYKAIEEVQALPSNTCYADLVLKSASKAKGIDKFLAEVNGEGYIAFGDSMNDYEMLKHADVAIAMGQGAEALKQIADFVTKAVDDDGIAYACNNLDILRLK